mgnify:FL=1
MIITGNKDTGVAHSLSKLYPDAEFVSQSTGYDLSRKLDQERLGERVCEHNVFVNCAALFKLY